jgi:hypothetical protein
MDKKSYLNKIITNINRLNLNLFLNEISKNTYHYLSAESDINNKRKSWYNKRIDNSEDLNKWGHITKKYLEESKKNQLNNLLNNSTNPIFNKVWRSRFGNINPINFGYPRNMDNIYVSDYIMFNQNCDLSFDIVDRILPYIKFKKINENTIQIDRWIFKNYGLFTIGSFRPNYDITLSDNELSSNEFIKTDEDKWLVVRAMLQIMNETPDEFVNFNSYHIIGHWYNKNDSWLVSWEVNNKNKSNVNYDSDNNQLKKSELIIKLNNRLKKNELIDILYENAIYGGKDFRNTTIILDPLKELYDKKIYKDLVKIDKISDAIINTVINLDIIDLTEYLKANQKEKTKQTIIEINFTIKNRFNCINITKPDKIQITKFDLLARMYNLSLPFGMGIFSQEEKIKSDKKIFIMTSSDAENFFSLHDNCYVDYLYGIPIKMDFSLFPIVDFGKFEEYNGIGSFEKCIESLKNNSNISKIIPSSEYIKEEIKRIS